MILEIRNELSFTALDDAATVILIRSEPLGRTTVAREQCRRLRGIFSTLSGCSNPVRVSRTINDIFRNFK